MLHCYFYFPAIYFFRSNSKQHNKRPLIGTVSQRRTKRNPFHISITGKGRLEINNIPFTVRQHCRFRITASGNHIP